MKPIVKLVVAALIVGGCSYTATTSSIAQPMPIQRELASALDESLTGWTDVQTLQIVGTGEENYVDQEMGNR